MQRYPRQVLLLLLLGCAPLGWGAGPVDRSQWFESGTRTTDDPRRIPVAPDRNIGPATKIVIAGGRVFDGTGTAARAADVFIEGKTIIAVVPPGTRATPSDAQVIDAQGKTVMPGLIDMHVHMSYPDPRSDNDQSEADATLRSLERLRFYVESGITTVRDTGGRGMIPFRLKRWVQDDRLPLPRIYAAGDIITGKGGHAAEGLVDRIGSREASGPDDWRQAVREQFEKGADFIKVASHYSRAEVAAAIDEAHALGLRVTADAETQYIQWAVDAGIDMIEHPLPRTDEAIRAMAVAKVASIPTLVPYTYIVDQSGGYYNSTSRRFSLTKESTFGMLLKLKKAGVTLGVGTDLVDVWYRYLPSPYITELEQFVAAGFTVPQALSIATRTNAELLGMGDALGTLEAGKLADVIVVEGHPDERLEDLRRIDRVIRNGSVVVEEGQLVIKRHVPEAPPAPRR